MAKYGNYGWSPRQMERINERRAKRGQEELRNLRYENKPEEERQRPSSRPMPSPLDGGMEEMSLKDRQAKRTADFKKSFNQSPSSLNQQDSMATRRAIADEEFRRKTGRGTKGISTPMTKSAMEQVMGTA